RRAHGPAADRGRLQRGPHAAGQSIRTVGRRLRRAGRYLRMPQRAGPHRPQFRRMTDGAVAALEPAALDTDAAGRARQHRRGLAARAMAALGQGNGARAWLLADQLCRSGDPCVIADGYLLRAAAHALRGEPEASAADLGRAAYAAPLSPAVNRALLTSATPSERLSAARRLLRAELETDRNQGLAALARAGHDCVGAIELSEGRLVARIAWRGPPSLTLEVLTEAGSERVAIQASGIPAPPGLDHV